MYQRFRLSVGGMNKDINIIVIDIYSLSIDVNFSNFQSYFQYALPVNVCAILLYLGAGVYLAYKHKVDLDNILSVYTQIRPQEAAGRVQALEGYRSLMVHSSLNEAAIIGCYLSLRESHQQDE